MPANFTSLVCTSLYGLTDGARHVIQCTLSPRFLSCMAFYDTVSIANHLPGPTSILYLTVCPAGFPSFPIGNRSVDVPEGPPSYN